VEITLFWSKSGFLCFGSFRHCYITPLIGKHTRTVEFCNNAAKSS